ncbi:MAG: CDP-alcohol phosphatidyltransferase family protein [Parcubacteria group bacterium]|nr:CDP-alcohol phosphatidyltransferase family protein [Parcubacteria group bacterium]
MEYRALLKTPNILTLSRIAVTVPAGLLLFEAKESENGFYYYAAALVLCLYAAVTDFLDGYLARKNKETSSIGALLDPLADKLFSIWILYALAVPTWLILVMITRELWVATLRTCWNKNVTTTRIAKWKTALLFIFILTTILLEMYIPAVNLWNVSSWYYVNFTTIMTALTVFTGVHYTILTFRNKTTN